MGWYTGAVATAHVYHPFSTKKSVIPNEVPIYRDEMRNLKLTERDFV